MVEKIIINYNKIKDVEKELGLKNIELTVQNLFNSIVVNKYAEQITSQYLNKLQAFAMLTNSKINSISLYNKNHSSFFSSFIFFIKNNGFGFDTKLNNLCIKATQFLVNELNHKLVQKIDLTNEFNIKFSSTYLKYFQGWFYEHKSLRGRSYINLYKYSELFGLDEANKIEKLIQSIENFRTDINIFNIFIAYLVEQKKSIFTSLSKDFIHNFMKLFFNYIVEKNRCLNSAKRAWNIFIRTLKECFNLDKSLKLTLTRKHKNPNEMNLKNINGELVKSKLITHIPLEISDDKSLYLIKDKISQDLNLVKDWAIFNLKEFDKINEPSKFISRKELYSIFILLALEQPAITESFLINLTVQNSYIKINENSFLVGTKARKGYSLAEQKIVLTSFSANILDKYLEWISPHKSKYKSFFIYKGKKGIKEVNQNTVLYNEGLRESFKKYLIQTEIPENYATELVKNAYLSKIRATIGIQVYFNTENTTKMAQALGHTSYNPKLLSHYLPQSILDFYQQRWIRIFQKGLICESLKDNSLLFKASNFETMEQLDEFLKNHMLKNLPDNLSTIKPITIQNETNFDNIYVSINQENLTALFSLRKAVEEAKNKDNVCEKAYFWFHFSEQIEKEILHKREYNEFKALLNISKEQAISDNFNQVIYD